MLRKVDTPERKVRKLNFLVDGTGTAALTQGSFHATLTDNGTGDYTVTFNKPGKRLLGLSVLPITKVYAHTRSALPTAVRILTFNDAGVATDADFYLEVTLSDVAVET